MRDCAFKYAFDRDVFFANANEVRGSVTMWVMCLKTVHGRGEEIYSALYLRSCIPGSPTPSPFDVDYVEDPTLPSQIPKDNTTC